MLKSKNSIEYALIFLIFLLLPFENSILQITFLGHAGAGAAIIPILLLILLNFKRLLFNKVVLVCLFYSVLVSLLGWLFYSEYSMSVTIVQGLKKFILYFLFIITFVYFKNTSVDVSKPLIGLMLVLFTSIFLTVFDPDFLNSKSILHFTETRNYRPRGYSLESSTYGFLCLVSLFLFGWIYRVNFCYLVVMALMLSFLIDSKGSIVAIFLSVLISFVVTGKNGCFYKVASLSLAVLMLVLLSPLLGKLFISDIESYTSLATRSTMALLSVFSISSHPVGVGFFSYLPYIYENGIHVVEFMQQTSPVILNYSEVLDYFIEGTTQNVGTKSFLLDSILLFGLPFVFYFFKFLKDGVFICFETKSRARLVLFLFLIVALSFYTPGVGYYIAPVALGLVLNKRYA